MTLPPLMAKLVSCLGFKWVILAYGSGFLLCFVISLGLTTPPAAKIVRSSLVHQTFRRSAREVHLRQTFSFCARSRLPAKKKLRELARLPVLYVLGFAVVFMQVSVTFSETFLPIFVTNQVNNGTDLTEASAVTLSTIGSTYTVSRLAFGVAADHVDPIAMFAACNVLGGIVCIGLANCFSLVSFGIASFFYGICLAGYTTTLNSVLLDVLGQENVRNVSQLTHVLMGVAALVGGPVGGVLIENMGFETAFMTNSAFNLGAAIAAAFVYFFQKLKRRNDCTVSPEELDVVLNTRSSIIRAPPAGTRLSQQQFTIY